MAENAYNQVRGPNPMHTVLAGTFAPQGTGAPVVAGGLGFTVTREDQGLFRVKLRERYAQLLAITASTTVGGTVSVLNVHIGLSEENSFDLQLWNTSWSEADASDPNRVFFTAHLSNTTTPGL